ncbi:restriction endonuclease subunit S [Microbulbifer sp. S227A]|uniref:restriction endonuclease subunit S n=1 Tax=Microbulbifer sp. S227A TaxID=3415131 RepID=UPI003C79F026
MKDSVKAGWIEIPLGEIAELRSRIGWKGLTAKEYTKSGPRFLSVHSLNYGDYVDFRDAFHISQERYDESPEIMLQQDDILICKDGAGIGKLGVVPEVLEPTTINSSLLLIRPGPKVLPKYLYFCLLSPYFQEIVQSRLEGATTPHLYQRDITTFPVFLPPHEEQQRIVAVLDEAFEGLARARAHAEANLQNARELFGSALQAALHDETISWNETLLADLGDVVTGSTPKTSDKGNLGDHIPFIKPGDFLPDGSLVYDNQGLSEQGAAVSRVLPGGSALMVCIGATIGKAGYSDRPIATNQQINAVAPKDGISGEYLYYQMLTPEFQADVMRQAGQATLPIINKGKWSKLKVRMPSDLTKQAEIVEKLSSIRAKVDAASAQYKAQTLDLDDLRQSLLQKAFAGELT